MAKSDKACGKVHWRLPKWSSQIPLLDIVMMMQIAALLKCLLICLKLSQVPQRSKNGYQIIPKISVCQLYPKVFKSTHKIQFWNEKVNGLILKARNVLRLTHVRHLIVLHDVFWCIFCSIDRDYNCNLSWHNNVLWIEPCTFFGVVTAGTEVYSAVIQ